ncbi:elongation factor G [Limosilactobacillus secaliphilus]|uniref:Translation elongation factor (GTPase) n=1 Tax=Limosilactobacillus secaliphilus TaxID=396268 RepID=A0A0R2I273_9LACO|nr:TetM/TetW/TetO/TetS family tetracycline resistance ribosomal protection protein [Limosilactobacillus secaliphilus]KRN59280.1 translation elongation factor (GTPase) [Limosilactobacillus secaliphilus]
MKKITMGIVAPVDAGKTTLSEEMLYQTGTIRHAGRVDHGDTFLDPAAIEKQRGITVFAHQAELTMDDVSMTLLDTPGHVDFAATTEQVLPVLDYAILIVAGSDGVTGYTRLLWRLLTRYQVPTFIFVNKVDAPGFDRQRVMKELQALDDGCLPFGQQLSEQTLEDVASQDETALEEYLKQGSLTDAQVQQLIAQRKVFPVYFGSALKQTGVSELLDGLAKWTLGRQWPSEFGARVFKISHDKDGSQLTWLRVTGGALQAKQTLVDDEKADALRVYNGEKYDVVQQVPAGGVCAVVGPEKLVAGQGLGEDSGSQTALLKPVLAYTVVIDHDQHDCLQKLQELSLDDPQLKVVWNSELKAITVQVMGPMQLEVLAQLLKDRYQIDVHFEKGTVLYQETVTEAIEGVGHFEPLRHYSECHLLIEPGKQGSGLQFAINCSVDVLGHNYQQQIMTALKSKLQRGVLIGAPLTDAKITLVGGRASVVHSVGGDFREAANRALRQGLMELKQKAACQLLEPWYRFTLLVPNDQVGRALNDIQRASGDFDAPAPLANNQTQITGHAPVSEIRDYAATVRGYTHGEGQLACVPAGNRPCHNAEAVIADAGYDPVADLANTPDSVFCAHGAGYPVHWDQVPNKMHCDYYTDFH